MGLHSMSDTMSTPFFSQGLMKHRAISALVASPNVSETQVLRALDQIFASPRSQR